MRWKRAVRTLLAMIGGYLTTLLLTTLVFVSVALALSNAAPGLTGRAILILGAIAAGICGGYAGAWIGGERPVRHALYVGGLTLLIGIAWGNVHYVWNDPLAFRVMLLIVAVPAAVLGGALRRRTQR